MSTDQDVRNAVVNYLLRKQVTGSHKRTVETVVDVARIALTRRRTSERRDRRDAL